MTREEAIRQSEIISRNEAMFNCGVLDTIGTKTSTELIQEIYDDFEKEKKQLKKDRDYWKLSFNKQIEASRKKTNV